VSVQTREWEAYPSLAVASALQGEARAAGDGRLVVRHAKWCYVEATPPEDFALAAGHAANGVETLVWRWGDQFMERGVIRRLRVRGAFAPPASDAAIADRLQAELLAEQPPLTA
jgi:hypothetical protein